MKNFEQIGIDIGMLVELKNAAYGSSFAKAGEFLALLYPNGIEPGQYADALLMVRIFDKQMRIATDRDALGESPYADISGYGILGVHLHQHTKEDEAKWLGTASADVDEPSREQPASVVADAKGTTTTNANETSAPAPSPLPKSCSAPPASAAVPDATGDASQSADENLNRVMTFDLFRRIDLRNAVRSCARCSCPLPDNPFEVTAFLAPGAAPVLFCSSACRSIVLELLRRWK